jgi:hypothetical protein
MRRYFLAVYLLDNVMEEIERGNQSMHASACRASLNVWSSKFRVRLRVP